MINFEVDLHFIFFNCVIHILIDDIYDLIKYLWIIITNRASYVSLIGNDIEGLARMESTKV